MDTFPEDQLPAGTLASPKGTSGGGYMGWGVPYSNKLGPWLTLHVYLGAYISAVNLYSSLLEYGVPLP
jgi:hypothetical protein